MKKLILALAIVFVLLFGCAAKPAEKQVEKPVEKTTPKIEEKDITAIENDTLFTDDLDQGIADLKELENAS